MANDAVRRIMAEVKEFSTLNSHPSSFFYAAPLESDLFEWHFSVRGPPDTAFAAGVYHGRILLPAEYPLKPPEIILLTPNGRFEVGKRICLSVTAHHQETWQPSWGIRTILTALVGFMPSKAEGVGALDYPDEDRKGLARKSLHFRCPRCGVRPVELLPPREVVEGSSSKSVTVKDKEEHGNDNKHEGKVDPEKQHGNNDQTVRNGEPSASSSSAKGTMVDVSMDGEVEDFGTVSSRHDAEEQRDHTAVSERREGDGEPNATDVAVDEITPRENLPGQVGRREEEPVREVASAAGIEEEGVGEGQRRGEVQEKELLYVAYAIVILMVAVVARRVVNIISS